MKICVKNVGPPNAKIFKSGFKSDFKSADGRRILVCFYVEMGHDLGQDFGQAAIRLLNELLMPFW